MTALDAFARRHALYASTLLAVAALGLYAGRVAHTDSLLFLFLPRNLALGWIPVGLALLVVGASRRGRWAMIPLALAWLAFLPNSIYLLTDLVHLRSRPGIPHVYDSTLCGTFAGAGILAGISSMSMVHEAIGRAFGSRWATLLMLPTVLLNGLGVYIGRYLRWNSWDVVTQPGAIVGQVWALMTEPSTHLWGITLTYAAVTAVSWLAFVSARPRAVPSAPAAPQGFPGHGARIEGS